MIALSLLLAAQAAPNAASSAQQNCVRAAGSEIVICGTPPEQEAQSTQESQPNYRLPRLGRNVSGRVVPNAQTNLGGGVRATLRGQASNSGRARRNKPVATLSVPF